MSSEAEERGVRAAVSALYLEVLGRDADPKGLQVATAGIMAGAFDLAALRRSMMESEEYRRHKASSARADQIQRMLEARLCAEVLGPGCLSSLA